MPHVPAELTLPNFDLGTPPSFLFPTARQRRNTRQFVRVLSRIVTLQKTFFVYWVLLILLILYLKKYFPISLTHNNKDGLSLEQFMRAWCRVRRSRLGWKEKLTPCKDNLIKGARPPGWGTENATSVFHSYISLWDVRSAGEFSSFTLQSVTADQHVKRFGGDSWRVYVHGPSSISPVVFDMQDGRYEVVFLVLEPGEYRVRVMLEYTLCEGIKDLGDFSRNGSLKTHTPVGKSELKDNLHKQLWMGTKITLTIPPPQGVRKYDVFLGYGYYDAFLCGSQYHPLLWDGFGRWVNHSWLPFIEATSPSLSKGKDGLFLVYSDSEEQQDDGLLENLRYSTVCSDIFKICDDASTWLQRDKNQTNKMVRADDILKRNISEEIKGILLRPELDKKTVLLINLGADTVEKGNFTQFQRLINEIVDIVTVHNINATSGETIYKGDIIWKTMPALNNEQMAEHDRISPFLTTPRVELYNSYAGAALCQAGIRVLDVYPLTVSFPRLKARHSHGEHAMQFRGSVLQPVVELIEILYRNSQPQDELGSSGNFTVS